MTLEDLTQYTEVDPNSHITKTSTVLTFTNIAGSETAYIRSATGLALTDFSVNFDFRVTANDGGTGSLHLLTLHDTNANNNGWAGANYVSVLNSATNIISLRSITGAHATAAPTYTATLGTRYYATLSRTGSTITLNLYSDSARTTLLYTISLSQATSYNYISLAYSYNNSTYIASGDVSNVDFTSPTLPVFMTLLYEHNNTITSKLSVDSSGNIAFGDNSGYVTVIDKNGNLLESSLIDTGHSINSVILKNESIYSCSGNAGVLGTYYIEKHTRPQLTQQAEDLTQYSETDPNSHISKTSTVLTFTNIAGSETAYIRSATGLALTDFSVNFNFVVTANNGGTGAFHLLTLHDTNVNNNGWAGANYVSVLNSATNIISLRSITGAHATAAPTYTATLGTRYYATLSRTSSTITLKLYSDSARTTLLYTASLSQATSYNYISLAYSYNNSTYIASGDVSNVDFTSPNLPPHPRPPTSVFKVSKLANQGYHFIELDKDGSMLYVTGDIAGNGVDYHYAININTGATIYSYNNSEGGGAFGGLLQLGNFVYIPTNAGSGAPGALTKKVNKFNKDGTYIGSFNDTAVHSTQPIANNEGNIFYSGTDNNNIYCITTDLVQVWLYITGGVNGCNLTLSGSVIYAGSTDKKLYAINASNGALLWSYTTVGTIISKPIVYKDHIYILSDNTDVLTYNSLLYKFNKNGNLISTYRLAQVIKSMYLDNIIKRIYGVTENRIRYIKALTTSTTLGESDISIGVSLPGSISVGKAKKR